MDLQEIWKSTEADDALLGQLLQQRSFLRQRSKGPLQKLRRNLSVNLTFAAVITLGYALLIFYFAWWQVQLALCIVSAFNIWIMVTGYRLYQTIDPDLSHDNVLETLKTHYQNFQAWFRQQMRVSLFIYPIAFSGGYLLGGALGSGKPIEVFFSHQLVYWVFFIGMVVMTIGGYYLGRYLNRVAFGKYVDQLKATIDELEQV